MTGLMCVSCQVVLHPHGLTSVATDSCCTRRFTNLWKAGVSPGAGMQRPNVKFSWLPSQTALGYQLAFLGMSCSGCTA